MMIMPARPPSRAAIKLPNGPPGALLWTCCHFDRNMNKKIKKNLPFMCYWVRIYCTSFHTEDFSGCHWKDCQPWCIQCLCLICFDSLILGYHQVHKSKKVVGWKCFPDIGLRTTKNIHDCDKTSYWESRWNTSHLWGIKSFHMDKAEYKVM